MTKYVVDTATALRLCHLALRSDDPDIVAAGETVMSALVLNLRHPQALVPSDIKSSVQLLRDYNARCKVKDVNQKRNTHE